MASNSPKVRVWGLGELRGYSFNGRQVTAIKGFGLLLFRRARARLGGFASDLFDGLELLLMVANGWPLSRRL